eukprot:14784187-Alexandrium_andersonii.AAC.1
MKRRYILCRFYGPRPLTEVIPPWKDDDSLASDAYNCRCSTEGCWLWRCSGVGWVGGGGGARRRAVGGVGAGPLVFACA